MTGPAGKGPEYLTIIEAARMFGFSVRTIVRWIEQGRLPSVVRAGETLIAARDLEAIITRAAPDDPERKENEC